MKTKSSEIQITSRHTLQVRAHHIYLYFARGGGTYFGMNCIYKALGYTNPTNSIKSHSPQLSATRGSLIIGGSAKLGGFKDLLLLFDNDNVNIDRFVLLSNLIGVLETMLAAEPLFLQHVAWYQKDKLQKELGEFKKKFNKLVLHNPTAQFEIFKDNKKATKIRKQIKKKLELV